jgi:hypothetical protein
MAIITELYTLEFEVFGWWVSYREAFGMMLHCHESALEVLSPDAPLYA